MQHDRSPDGGVKSTYSTYSEGPSRRKPTKVLKIAESFTNLDENARSGRYKSKSPRTEVRKFRTDCEIEKCNEGCNSMGQEGPEAGSDRRVTGASCTALRTAVAALYPLDDFLQEKIGEGFFSEVFKVTHKTSGNVMVLKMNQQRANRPNMLREVQLMNKLKHPNILGFMGVCVHEGQLHALTEYMEGGSLEQLLLGEPPEPIPPIARVQLAADVAAGMEYLHSLGVFHRDLTAKNVLLRKNGPEGDYTAIVADFGLASKIPHPRNGYRLLSVGSPWWMSPECLRGLWYDHRSDIFSYGIILCQLIARIDADPDKLPRTDNFGLNYMVFVEQCCGEDTVPDLLRLAFNCCIFEPKARPLFPDIVVKLRDIKLSLQLGEHSIEQLDTSAESGGEEASGPVSCPAGASWRGPVQRHARPHPHQLGKLKTKLDHRRSLSELEWSVGVGAGGGGGGGSAPLGAHTPPSDKARRHQLRARPRHASASALPPHHHHPPPRLTKIAEIMMLKDPHSRPRVKNPDRNPFTALARFRGVKKILEGEPGAFGAKPGDLFSSCFELPSPLVRLAADSNKQSHIDLDDPPKCSSLPSSPGLSRRGSMERCELVSPTPPPKAETKEATSSETIIVANERTELPKYPLQLQKSNSSIELSAENSLKAGNSFAKRRGSCESGIFSVVNEDFCPQHLGTECFYGALCQCSLMGCHQCWWWGREQRKTVDTASDNSCEEECACKDKPQEERTKVKSEDSESECSEDRKEKTSREYNVQMCPDCLTIYDRMFSHQKTCRKLDLLPSRTQPSSSANSSLFLLDDSALSTTTVSSLRSLDDLEETHIGSQQRVHSDTENKRFDNENQYTIISPFLCDKFDNRPSESDASSETTDTPEPKHKEYHILKRCCCVNRHKYWSHKPDIDARSIDPGYLNSLDDEITCMLQRGPLIHQLLYSSCKRTSSVYTDSSEDIASLAGSDSLYCDDRIPRHVRSAQISKIVEYFERKGADFKYDRTFKAPRFKMAGNFGPKLPSEMMFKNFKDSDREAKEYMVDVKHRGGAGASKLSDLVANADRNDEGSQPVPCGRKCLSQQRLMICEGAVKSKLPLFDKKT